MEGERFQWKESVDERELVYVARESFQYAQVRILQNDRR